MKRPLARLRIAVLLLMLASITSASAQLRVLCFGDSLMADMTNQVERIARGTTASLDGVVIYRATCSVSSPEGWIDYLNGSSSSTYAINPVLGTPASPITTGRYNGSSPAALLALVNDHPWDVIVVQPSAASAGDGTVLTDTSSLLRQLVTTLRTAQSSARIVYAMPSSTSTSSGTIDGWNSIVAATQQLEQAGIVDQILPLGTAIQNLRSTSYNNSAGITRDGKRLGFGLARYTAACVFFQALMAPTTGGSIQGNEARYLCVRNEREYQFYPTSSIDVEAHQARIGQRAALLALRLPYENRNAEYEGDVNDDGQVDAADISAIVGIITSTLSSDAYPLADVNWDNVIDVGDIASTVAQITASTATLTDNDLIAFPQVDLDKDTLRILVLGDTSALETMEHLDAITRASGCDLSRVAIYMAQVNASTFATWYNSYTGYTTGIPFTLHRITGTASTPVTLGSQQGTKALAALLEKPAWDLIVLQYQKRYSDDYAQLYDSYLKQWLATLTSIQPQAQVAYMTTPSYWDRSIYNNKSSSVKQWSGMNSVAQTLDSRNGVSMLIPVATAVENVRASSHNNDVDLTLNGSSLGYGLARYTASCCFYQKLLASRAGASVQGNTTRVTGAAMGVDTTLNTTSCIDVDDFYAHLAQRAAVSAVDDPFNLKNPELTDDDGVRAPSRSIAVFGTSRTSSSSIRQNDGWLGMMLDSLMTADGYVNTFRATGRWSLGYTTDRRFVANRYKHRIAYKDATLNFSITGRYACIAQVMAPTDEYGIIGIYSDDKLVKIIENRNPTVEGEQTVTFTGDGVTRSFFIPHLCSNSFSVKVAGKKVTVSSDPSEVSAGKYDCYVARTVMAGTSEVKRILYFPTPPTGSIQVTYNTGDVVAYSISDYHTSDTYHDDASGGLFITSTSAKATYSNENRLCATRVDERALIHLDLGSEGTHDITIKILGGSSNPYFDIDFATPVYYDVLNAGFYGATLSDFFFNDSYRRGWHAIDSLPNPDVVVLEYGGNDENMAIDRRAITTDTLTLNQLSTIKAKYIKSITPIGNNQLRVTLCTGTIDSIGQYALRSRDIVGSSIEVGDYVRIGEYHSDWKEFVVHRVASVDPVAGIITWNDAPFSPDSIWHYDSFEQMQGAQFAIRTHSTFKSNLTRAVNLMKSKCPSASIHLMGLSPYGDNGYNSGWAYDEAMQDVAAATGVGFTSVWKALRQVGLDAMRDTIVELDILSKGTATYTIPATDVPDQNRTFRVLLNDVDVTGRGALVHLNTGYYVSKSAMYNKVSLADNGIWMTLTHFANYYDAAAINIQFTDYTPTRDDDIFLIWGGSGWTDDGVHQNADGNRAIAHSMKHIFDNYGN